MSLALRIAVLILAYLAIAIPAAVLIGRTISRREEGFTRNVRR